MVAGNWRDVRSRVNGFLEPIVPLEALHEEGERVQSLCRATAHVHSFHREIALVQSFRGGTALMHTFCGEILQVHSFRRDCVCAFAEMYTRSVERLHLCTRLVERLHLCIHFVEMYTRSVERLNLCTRYETALLRSLHGTCVYSGMNAQMQSLCRLPIAAPDRFLLHHQCHTDMLGLLKLQQSHIATIDADRTQFGCHNLKFCDHAMISPLTFTLIRPECNLRCKLQRS